MNDNGHNVCYYTDWTNISEEFKKGSVSILTVNIRSLIGKFAELSTYLNSVKNKVMFVVITETWLKENNDFALDLPGYKSFSIYRDDQLGGGIKLYYLDHITVSLVDNLDFISASCENLTVKAKIPSYGCLFISCMYRPPNRSIPLFFDHLQELLDLLCDKRCILIGDFNINVSIYSNTVREYSDILSSYGFVNEINIKTYISPVTNQDKSCIDHVIHNLDHKCVSNVIRPAIADHYSVLSIFDTRIEKQLTTIKFRDFSFCHIDRFVNNMEYEFNEFLHPVSNVNLHTNYLILFLEKLLNKYFPIRVKQLGSDKFSTPWINKRIVECINKKHRWYKMMKRGEISVDCYKKYCYALRDLLRMAEQDYCKFKLSSLSNNNTANWKIINSLLGKKASSISDVFIVGDNEINDPLCIANHFNQYFIDYPQQLLNSLPPPTNDYNNIIPDFGVSFNFSYCTPNEVKSHIARLKNKGVSIKFLFFYIFFYK